MAKAIRYEGKSGRIYKIYGGVFTGYSFEENGKDFDVAFETQVEVMDYIERQEIMEVLIKQSNGLH